MRFIVPLNQSTLLATFVSFADAEAFADKIDAEVFITAAPVPELLAWRVTVELPSHAEQVVIASFENQTAAIAFNALLREWGLTGQVV